MAHNPKKSRLEEPSKIDKVTQALDQYGARLSSDFTVPQLSAIEPLQKLIRPGRYLAQRSFASSSDLLTMKSSPNSHARESSPLAFVGVDLEDEDGDEDIVYGGGDVVSFNGTLVPISEWLGDDFSSFIVSVLHLHRACIPFIYKLTSQEYTPLSPSSEATTGHLNDTA